MIGLARSGVERRAIERWARERDLEPVPPRDVEHLAPSTSVVPARVVWNLPEAGSEGAGLTDLISASIRHNPWRGVHAPLARLRSSALTVVAGEPATVGELVEAAESAGRSGAFASFVRERAELACERAERQIKGDRYKVPRLMTEQITSGRSFLDRARAAATRAGVPDGEFLARTESCLREMVAVQSPRAIDLFRAATSPLHSRTWDVEVDEAGLQRLRELNRERPLVFLPAHRSYVDPLVLAEVMHRHDLPRNHILGGDNMSFWPFGVLGRRAGVVFIRRSFGDDAAYKFAMREYLGHLMSKRFNLEWYIEGGRTRTGKLRHPRYGLLHYLVGALEQDPSRDAVLVPVSIMYDQLHEVGAVVAEQTGATKKSEGARWFLQYVREQAEHIGSARVRFGEPFGLRDALAEAGDSPAQLEKVAFRICAGINEATPVMATSVVTLALLGTAGRALTLAQIETVVAPVVDYLDQRDIHGPYTDLRKPERLLRCLADLESGGAVARHDGLEPVWRVDLAHAHHAAFYRNGAVHHLVHRAIAELALAEIEVRGTEEKLLPQGLLAATTLRDLLTFEFFFPGRDRLCADLEGELEIIDPAWREHEVGPALATHLLDHCRALVAPRTVGAILEAQSILVEELESGEEERATVLDRSLARGSQRVLQHQIVNADAVSRELFGGAFKLAQHRGAIGDSAPARHARQHLRTEIDWALGLLHHVEARHRRLMEESVTRDR